MGAKLLKIFNLTNPFITLIRTARSSSKGLRLIEITCRRFLGEARKFPFNTRMHSICSYIWSLFNNLTIGAVINNNSSSGDWWCVYIQEGWQQQLWLNPLCLLYVHWVWLYFNFSLRPRLHNYSNILILSPVSLISWYSMVTFYQQPSQTFLSRWIYNWLMEPFLQTPVWQ